MQNLPTILLKFAEIVLIIVVAKLLIFLLRKTIKRRISARKKKSPNSVIARKSETVLVAYKSALKYVIYFFALISILAVLELSATVSSIIAAAGVGGIIIGFGAQKLVQDFFSGFFMLFEDQLSVGDYIETGGVKGIVENITIRTTVIRQFGGELVTIPNGSIDKVINYSRGNINVFLEITIAPGQDNEKAMTFIRETLFQYALENEDTVFTANVLGLSKLSERGITIKSQITVKPMFQWQVERDLNHLVTEGLSKNGIELSFATNISLHNAG